MAIAGRTDPYLVNRFAVEIDGLIVGGFSEVSGLQSDVQTEDYKEGGINEFVHKLVTGVKHPNLVLKRGLADSDCLWKWHQAVVTGRIERRSGSIILLDSEGKEKWRWRFCSAYPVTWKGPDFKADGTVAAIESLELVHQGIEKG